MHRIALLLGLIGAPLAAQVGDSLVLESPEARHVVHTAEWARLPHDTMRVQFHGQPSQLYAGVSLPALLALLHVSTDSLRGRRLALRVVLEAADGYQVVLALSDLDPTLGARRVLIADTVDGGPLPSSEAPYRLLIAGDERPSRWARQVVSVQVRAEGP